MKLKLRYALFLTVAACHPSFADSFTISSENFLQGKKINNTQVFNSFGCQGDNISPAIYWQGAPKNTKSFAVTLYDPDAPTGSGFWHWTVLNIPQNISTLNLDAGNVNNKKLPSGARQIRNDYGTKGFGGACPPEGNNPHRYQLTIHALDTKRIELPADASPALAGFMIRQHQIASTQITAHYMR